MSTMKNLPGWASLAGVGDSLHCLNIALNLLITTAIMLEFPRRDAYDESWRKRGQCYVADNSNGSIEENDGAANSITTHTNLLCAVSLVLSGIGLYVWDRRQNFSHEHHREALAKRCAVLGQSNISHGLGHLFLHFTGNTISPVEFSLQVEALGNLLVLALFWPTALRVAMSHISLTGAIGMSIIVVGTQFMLGVPGNLSFTYSQSVILLAASLDQLLSPRQDKETNSVLYVMYALFYLPIWPLMWLEVTECTRLLSSVGGHLFYDLYLSVMPFVTAFVVQSYYDSKAQRKQTYIAKKAQ